MYALSDIDWQAWRQCTITSPIDGVDKGTTNWLASGIVDITSRRVVCGVMEKSLHGNVFHITDPLWIPLIQANNATLWCFHYCKSEQTAQLPVVKDAMTLMWRHSNGTSTNQLFSVQAFAEDQMYFCVDNHQRFWYCYHYISIITTTLITIAIIITTLNQIRLHMIIQYCHGDISATILICSYCIAMRHISVSRDHCLYVTFKRTAKLKQLLTDESPSIKCFAKLYY